MIRVLAKIPKRYLRSSELKGVTLKHFPPTKRSFKIGGTVLRIEGSDLVFAL
jgi:hypothetical protein